MQGWWVLWSSEALLDGPSEEIGSSAARRQAMWKRDQGVDAPRTEREIQETCVRFLRLSVSGGTLNAALRALCPTAVQDSELKNLFLE